MSIQQKKNKCKGTGKAVGYGCGFIEYRFKYGMCRICYKGWLYNSNEGKKLIATTIPKAAKKVKEANRPKRKHVKWYDKDTSEMITYIQENIVNPYIRKRDIENHGRCIASDGVIEHAGHCFSVGSSPGLRFNIMNLHGQQHASNVHKHGDFENYRIGLIKRFGEKHFNELCRLKMRAEKQRNLDRQEVIRIGKTYEYLTKNNIWCFIHVEFENYKNIINK